MANAKIKEIKNNKNSASRINVSVAKIPYEGLSIKELCDAASLDLSIEFIKIEKPVKVEALFHKVGDSITADVKISAFAKMTCGRCLGEFENEIEVKSRLNYIVESDEHNLDITDEIRQELILAYPADILCNPVCKGLCSKCGKNLNEGSCNCK